MEKTIMTFITQSLPPGDRDDAPIPLPRIVPMHASDGIATAPAALSRPDFLLGCSFTVEAIAERHRGNNFSILAALEALEGRHELALKAVAADIQKFSAGMAALAAELDRRIATHLKA